MPFAFIVAFIVRLVEAHSSSSLPGLIRFLSANSNAYHDYSCSLLYLWKGDWKQMELVPESAASRLHGRVRSTCRRDSLSCWMEAGLLFRIDHCPGIFNARVCASL